MSYPSSAPNYNSPRPQSAWWSTTDGAVVATTGYAFVRELQTKLREFFVTQDTDSDSAYVGGRGDVSSTRITGLKSLASDGNWGPKTNAGLWLRLKYEQDRLSDAQAKHDVQYRMDQLELAAQQHRLNIEAVRAAIWLVRYRTSPFAFVVNNVDPSGRPEFSGAVVLPPWNSDTAAPSNTERSMFYSWDANTQSAPPPTDGSTTQPQQTQPTPTQPTPTQPRTSQSRTSQPQPTQQQQPPATTPAAPPRKILGMTTGQLLLGAVVLVGVGAVAYTVTQSDKKKGKKGERDNPYDGYSAPYGLTSGRY